LAILPRALGAGSVSSRRYGTGKDDRVHRLAPPKRAGGTRTADAASLSDFSVRELGARSQEIWPDAESLDAPR